jgi:xanthine dehydrogenase accessory factor
MNPVDTVFDAAHRLQQAGKPYALVSVIKALAPASAHPGDKAVVTADGDFHGWIGGGCAQPAVVRTVREALADGHARLIRIAPTAEGGGRDLGDVLEFGMACHSGGTLELFVDPVLPLAQLVVIGASPVATSLAQLAPRVGFAVTLVAHEAQAADYPDARQVIASDDPSIVVPRIVPGAWVVVATQGRRDVQALRLALSLEARQVSFVASARKAQVLKDSLVAAGADAEAVGAIVAPAGYPMPATTPEEIALSVLAAVVSHRRGAEEVGAPAVQPVSAGTSCCGH